MKTTAKIQKKSFTKLTRVLMIVALICFGLKTNAQCTASYTAIIDTANNGNVAFASTSTGSGLYYTWDFGDGTIYNSMISGTYTYASSGTYNVCHTVFDSIGVDTSGAIISSCSDTYCSSITVTNSTATCNAYFIANDTIGGVYAYNYSTGVITNYFWDFGDGYTSTLANPGTHTYATAGNYTICLVTNNPSTMCNSTYCDTVLVSSCYASYTYTPDAIGNGCNFYGSSTGSGSSYFWDFGDGVTSTLQNPYHVFASNGVYNVCLTVSSLLDTTCNNTTCQYIYMSGLCDSYFTIQQDSTNLYHYFIYNYATSPGTLTYLWDFGDGSSSSAMYPTHTYASMTPVILCLTISDGSCTDTYCDTITPGMMMSGPFGVTVLPPTGITESISTITSLENYPNPFSNSTTINYAIRKDANVAISIVDLLGNTVAELENGNKVSGEHTATWDATAVAEGMYLLQLKVDNNIKTKKIIVNK